MAMKRRAFIGLAGWTIANWPIALLAQADSKKRIGVLIARPENDVEGQSYRAAFPKRWSSWDGGLPKTLRSTIVGRPAMLISRRPLRRN
jgi:hypothetical protein